MGFEKHHQFDDDGADFFAYAASILDFFNNDVMPIVYDRGSLGASGDLAPLANLFLPLIGVGDVYYKGKKCEAISVLDEFGWEPVKLMSKEGLALLNGTQFMSANGVFAMLKAFRLSKKADLIAALSLEAFDGRIDPFMDCIQQIRPHQGQIETGEAFRKLLAGSELIERHKEHVQDPYSFRCIPQVHFILADHGGGGILRNHKDGVQTGVGNQEFR